MPRSEGSLFEMAIMDVSSGLVLFAAATSIVCLIVALFTAFIGQSEERILGSMIAAFVVLQTAEVALSNVNGIKFQSVEVISYAVELGISVWVALKTARFWPLIIAAIFLVKASAGLTEELGMQVGIFAREEVQIGLRLSAALIILWATVSGKNLRSYSMIRSPRPL